MKIGIASGKGGTGKTTLAVNLSAYLQEKHLVTLLDCDVEEPNAHIFLKPNFTDKKPVLVKVPQINREECDYCGKCSEVCAFGALTVLKSKIIFYRNLCHSCGSCAYFCPNKAIEEVDREMGIIQKGFAQEIEFVHGILNVGEAMAVPVINEVKKYQGINMITVIDIPPGTSCPVIASLRDIDFCIIVTEPTPFGLNDMGLLLLLLQKMEIPYAVVINRWDLGDSGVEDFCLNEKIPILIKIPFDKELARLNAEGGNLLKQIPWFRDSILALWAGVKGLVK